MVLYFESTVVSPPALIYVGRDKHENEELIRWGWPEDVWFHVDKLSSAHVYLRLPVGMTIDQIPLELLEDCCQLTKANSIQGCKLNNVAIVYTMWSNLKKTGDMDVGQIGFHKQKDVKIFTVDKKKNELLNRLNKTKIEKDIDYRALREERDRKIAKSVKMQQQEEKNAKRLLEAQKAEEEKLKNYCSLMSETNMSSNKADPIDEDDFM